MNRKRNRPMQDKGTLYSSLLTPSRTCQHSSSVQVQRPDHLWHLSPSSVRLINIRSTSVNAHRHSIGTSFRSSYLRYLTPWKVCRCTQRDIRWIQIGTWPFFHLKTTISIKLGLGFLSILRFPEVPDMGWGVIGMWFTHLIASCKSKMASAVIVRHGFGPWRSQLDVSLERGGWERGTRKNPRSRKRSVSFVPGPAGSIIYIRRWKPFRERQKVRTTASADQWSCEFCRGIQRGLFDMILRIKGRAREEPNLRVPGYNGWFLSGI